jgi:hypothetical protein
VFLLGAFVSQPVREVALLRTGDLDLDEVGPHIFARQVDRLHVARPRPAARAALVWRVQPGGEGAGLIRVERIGRIGRLPALRGHHARPIEPPDPAGHLETVRAARPAVLTPAAGRKAGLHQRRRVVVAQRRELRMFAEQDAGPVALMPAQQPRCARIEAAEVKEAERHIPRGVASVSGAADRT